LDDNPQAHLLALCTAFLQDIDNYTNGKPQYDPNQRAFLQDASSLYQYLKTEVNETKPDFIVGTSSTQLPSLIQAPSPLQCVPEIPEMFLDHNQSDLSRSASSSSDENKLEETKSTSVSKKSAKGGKAYMLDISDY
jgi:hypothetical protein